MESASKRASAAALAWYYYSDITTSFRSLSIGGPYGSREPQSPSSRGDHDVCRKVRRGDRRRLGHWPRTRLPAGGGGGSVATCDWNAEIAETRAHGERRRSGGCPRHGHVCDVSDEAQAGLPPPVLDRHATDHVDSCSATPASAAAPASWPEAGGEEWETTFAVDWWGVYHCARTFLPLLIGSDEGVLVNISSVNGFWASLSPGMPNTAYATAKFAGRGLHRGADRRSAQPRTTRPSRRS